MHADVIAGRQINQTLNKIMKNFMNKYVDPPCNRISHVIHYFDKNNEFAEEKEQGGEDIPIC